MNARVTLMIGIFFLTASTAWPVRKHRKQKSKPSTNTTTQAPRPSASSSPAPTQHDPAPSPLLPGTLAAAQCSQQLSQHALTQIPSYRSLQSGQDGGLYFLSGSPPQVHFMARPLAPATAVTTFTEGVDDFIVSPDGARLAVISKPTGLQIVERNGAKIHTLTTSTGEHIGSARWDASSSWIAFTSNRRNASDMDLYRHDTRSQRTERLAELKGYQYVSDVSPSGHLIALNAITSLQTSHLDLWDDRHKRLEPLTLELANARVEQALFTADSSALLIVSNHQRGVAQIFHRPLKNGSLKQLTFEGHSIESLVQDSTRARVAYLVNNEGFTTLKSASYSKAALTPYANTPRLDPQSAVLDPAWTHRGVTYVRSGFRLAPQIYSFNEAQTPWTQPSRTLRAECFLPAQAIRYRSFDALEIGGYYYPALGPHAVFLHDGPTDQFRPIFHPFVHYLMGRNIGVLALNVRGSGGRNAAFLAADDLYQREHVFGDVEYAGRWLLKQQKGSDLFVIGQGYGGFVALSALKSRLFAKAVSAFGALDARTLVATHPPLQSIFEKEFGALSDPKTMRLFAHRPPPEIAILMLETDTTAQTMRWEATLPSVSYRRVDKTTARDPTNPMSWIPLVAHFFETKKDGEGPRLSAPPK